MLSLRSIQLLPFWSCLFLLLACKTTAPDTAKPETTRNSQPAPSQQVQNPVANQMTQVQAAPNSRSAPPLIPSSGPALSSAYLDLPPVKVRSIDSRQELVQLAFLLDTSNSMDGLIEQAKSRLWGILNQITRARRNGQTPEIQIALYEYGNSRLSEEEYYIRQVLPLTTDVDALSEQLFGLTTSGGDEYCGAVIARSLEALEWSAQPAALRLVYIAGNEPFTQGPRNPQQAIEAAAANDIIVNSIFCGDPEEGAKTGWSQVNGAYLYINQDAKTVYIETPFDSSINRLNEALNATYIPLGNSGREAKERQIQQDQNAATYGAANAANRAKYKASANYQASWDLLDTYQDQGEEVLKKTEDLPFDWQALSLAERQQKIKLLQEKRLQIRSQIQSLSQQQEAYRAAEKAQLDSAENTDNLGDRISQSVLAQLARKGFELVD